MEQTTFPTSQNLSLERLVSDALSEIESLGFATVEEVIRVSDRGW
jgi:hypothetical protein